MMALPAPGRLPYAPLQLCYCKNTSLTFYTHPVLGGCQNNSTIGLACETSSILGECYNIVWRAGAIQPTVVPMVPDIVCLKYAISFVRMLEKHLVIIDYHLIRLLSSE